ncbi:Dimethylaniline monooxygenase N-oxide-forming 5 [Sarcoptes scabiei]|nr:Dimethylaniline monooxygenase N-oxide-forming 5 [Sarcoptes scabiei]
MQSKITDEADQLTKFTGWYHLISVMFRNFLDNKILNTDSLSDFFHSNWQISILYSLLYLILVHFGTKWMRDRRKLNLRLPLAIWSGVLTLFSMLGTWSCLPEFISIIYNKGLVASYCDNCYIKKKELIFWYTIFSLSKIIELGDTVFIVLRKQRLITLHWIHHAMTLVYTFYIFGFLAATARWMVNMNFVVHSAMYGYYTLKALQFEIPKPIAMAITTSQIVQMIFGLVIHLHVVIKLLAGQQCHCPLLGALLGLAMYLYYFFLFSKLFSDSYLRKSVSRNKESSSKESVLNESNQKSIHSIGFNGNHSVTNNNLKIEKPSRIIHNNNHIDYENDNDKINFNSDHCKRN